MSGDKECVLCDRVMAGIGLVIGALFIYIAVDIFTGGWVTTVFTGGVSDE